MNNKPKTLNYREAVRALRRPGRKLTITHRKGGIEYFVTNGGRVSPSAAARVLEHCHECDAGLFAGCAQTFEFRKPSKPAGEIK